MENHIEEMISRITKDLGTLEFGQLSIIERISKQLRTPYINIDNFSSAFVNKCVLYGLGDYIRIHHCISVGPFEKKRFEYALETVFKSCGHIAELAPMGNPGYDIIIDGEKISLKTQADKGIKKDMIHVSKWMELGKGQWSSSLSDLEGLRDQFLEHIKSYDRIFTLRCLEKNSPHWHYELVEIPKPLLYESVSGEFDMKFDSIQNPKPGYCTIKDKSEHTKYQLYFDGGGERKLQLKKLLIKHCLIHAEWIFSGINYSNT